MSDCCSSNNQHNTKSSHACPSCHQAGKSVALITLKGLLIPDALKRMDPHTDYFFCKTEHCPVVYFNHCNSFSQDDIMVPVYQKDRRATTPVCYCFNHTRQSISKEMEQQGTSSAVQEITQLIKEKKCACEIRNPQGSCCLGNVKDYIRKWEVEMKSRSNNPLCPPVRDSTKEPSEINKR